MPYKPIVSLPSYYPAPPSAAAGEAGRYLFQELGRLAVYLRGMVQAIDEGRIPGQLVTWDFDNAGTITPGVYGTKTILGETSPIAVEVSVDTITLVSASADITVDFEYQGEGETSWTSILESPPMTLSSVDPGDTVSSLSLRKEADFAVSKIPDGAKLRMSVDIAILLGGGGSATCEGLHARLYCRQSDRAEAPVSGNRKGV